MQDQNQSESPIDEILTLLDLEKIEENIFRGQSPTDSGRRIFGGQVLGQALVAASRTIEDRVCHSFHAYFLRAGDPSIPILYEVDRSRDGSSFSSRRVVAIQHGHQIFNLAASFQKHEVGLEHQIKMPDVHDPDDLLDEYESRMKLIEGLPQKQRQEVESWVKRTRAIETRRQDVGFNQEEGPVDYVWIKARGKVPDNVVVQQSILAYASDLSLMATALLPHADAKMAQMQMASLDHAVWFHHPIKMDEWHLYAKDSPSASGARGFNRASLFTRDGKLVASVAQEGLIRVRGE